MPTKEHMLYSNWMIVDSLIHHIRDNLDDTYFDELLGIIDTLADGASVIGKKMKHDMIKHENGHY